MMTLEQLLANLETKIQEYRTAQKTAEQILACIYDNKERLSVGKTTLSEIISKQIAEIKLEASERVTALGAYAQNMLTKQRKAYENQISELRNQISRQYKVITLMREELEDLMAMLNERRSEGFAHNQQPSRQGLENSEPSRDEEKSQTINGLEIIEQEETERTVMSSVHSFNEEAKFSQNDNFIRIEQREREDFTEQSEDKETAKMPQTEQKVLEQNEPEHQLWNTDYKFDRYIDSEASRRQITYLAEQNSEEGPSQWQSMPLSAETDEYGRGSQSWEGRPIFNELRQITNQTEKQCQSKTKMFLQQFRKKFSQCLSSVNVSRKQSKKGLSKPPKDKAKSMATTFGKIDLQQSTNPNEKLINDMLRDIDNNNKFAVGSRRSELKYEGEKKDGVRSGQGVLYYSNGLSYEGEFKNNLRHGFGVLRFNQIQIYRGEWAADQLSGQGKIRNFAVINKRKSMPSSSPLSRWVSYCGSFRGNRFEGEGTIYLQGGQKFLGRFICGSACGEGTLYKKNGEVQTGVWRYNQLVQQF